MTEEALNVLLTQVEQIDSMEAIDAVVASARIARRKVKDVMEDEARQTFVRGDRVVLAGNLSPKYLLGLTGTVASRAQGSRIDVMLDYPHLARRYAPREGRPLQVPLTCVEMTFVQAPS